MTILTFLLQAVASLLAIITFLIVLNVQRSMLIPGGVLGMAIWLLYLLLKGPTNVIIATFVAAIIGSCVSQILSIIYKTPAVVFILAILAPLVPGYISYRTTAFFVTGDYDWHGQRHCRTQALPLLEKAPKQTHSKQTVEPSAVFILENTS